MRIAILGAGDMGTAIATPAAANGHDVRLWGTRFDDRIVSALWAGEAHPRLKHHLPAGFAIFEADALKSAITGVDMIVLAVTSAAVDAILDDVAPLLSEHPIVVSLTKGLVDGADGRIQLISERIAERLRCPIVGVGGPSKANEVAMELPTAVVFASADARALHSAHDALETRAYRITETADIVGVEMAAALKNAYAIAIGIAAGMEQATGVPHQNLRAALLAESVGEIARLACARGGLEETVHGLAGIGDLSVTITAGRNRLLGELLGQDISVRDALATLSASNTTIEGYAACALGYRLVQHLVDQGTAEMRRFPLLDALHRVLFDDAPVFDTIWNAVCS